MLAITSSIPSLPSTAAYKFEGLSNQWKIDPTQQHVSFPFWEYIPKRSQKYAYNRI